MQLNLLWHSAVSGEISTFICCENFKSYVLQLHMRFTLLYIYLHFMFSSQVVTKYNTGLPFWQLWVWSNETCTQIFGLNQILYLCQRLNFGNVESTRALHGLESVCKLPLPSANHYMLVPTSQKLTFCHCVGWQRSGRSTQSMSGGITCIYFALQFSVSKYVFWILCAIPAF
jgi:hypothetical protein